jgi:hypothetical protein
MPNAIDRRRFRRYSVELPCFVKSAGHRGYIVAAPMQTLNASSGGLLLVSSQLWEPDTQVECILRLKIGIAPNGVIRLRCKGRVVRSMEREAGDVLIAAAIDHFAFSERNAIEKRKNAHPEVSGTPGWRFRPRGSGKRMDDAA